MVAGAAIYVFFIKGRSVVYDNSRTVTIHSANKGNFYQDQDNDGLADWEELLWLTDAANPDTDGDGRLDGEEVKLGHNPLKPGPDDLLSKESVKEITASRMATTTANFTETEKFARQFLSRYLTNQNGSFVPDPDDFTSLMEDYLRRASVEQRPTTYGSAELKVNDQDTPDVLRRYGNALAESLLLDPNQKPLPSELTIIERYYKDPSNDPIILRDLAEYADRYQKIIAKLLKVETPKTLIVNHLVLLNNLSEIEYGLRSLSLAADDPMKAIIGFHYYFNSTFNFLPILRSISADFRNRGITFTQGEYGYQLWSVIK